MKPDLISVAPLLPKQMAELEQDFTIHKLPPVPERPAFLAKLADRVRFLQTTGFYGADAALINALPKLEIIACMGVGVDAVDLALAKQRGIAVTNTPDVLNDDVADLAIAMMLNVARRLALSDRWVREGRWLKGNQPLATKVTGKKLGILGLGRIGKAIAKRAAAFDMDISYHGRTQQTGVPYRFYPDLVDMSRDVDFLVVICPGGEATRNLVNARVLEALGPTGILINVARGSVVDEPALIEALKSGKLGGAGLDVFADEPRVPEALFAMDNVVLAPHVGSATTETRNAMCDLVVANLRAHLRGEKLVTPYF
ncbi:MAG TPA: 2-hydroxyacid dehydrogenase [Alphaproteobacteria bacterium]